MQPGTIGPYQIIRELGRGGMGEVYLAVDTRLDRQVAIKAINDHFADNADRLARFQREAKVLASLNHANIGGIHGLEESGGRQFLVLEYIEGETLAERLANGPIPLDESLLIAKQIAEALEAAHEKGVIHRDLKPGNVMVTPSGVAKVLDFGLARTAEGSASSSNFSPSLADSPTITNPSVRGGRNQPVHSPTIPGVIMGSAGYMSPEQARGKPVDKRSDIFSFGCVLYEMLTGAPPFRGETAADAIGATLHKETEFALLPASTPRRVRDLLTVCLTKDRKNRVHDIADARIELERAIAGDEWDEAAATRVSTLRPWLIASTLMLAVASGGWVWVASRPARPVASRSPMLELSIPMPKGHEVEGPIAISRDGRHVAFCTEDEAGGTRLRVRALDRSEITTVPGSLDAKCPAFTPDGRSVIFADRIGLKRAPIDGGEPTTVLQNRSIMCACALEDGSIVYSTGVDSPLWRVLPDGGKPVAITNLAANPGTYAHVWPQQIPGTSKILLMSWGDGDTGGACITDTQTGEVRDVLKTPGGTYLPAARWIASGHLILEAWGTLVALPYDPVTGGTYSGIERNQVLTSVAHLENATRCVFDVADDGTLAYVPSTASNRRLVWVDAKGAVEPVIERSDTSGFEIGGNVAISPDGTQALVVGGGDIAVIDLKRGLARRITFEDGNNLAPIWSADGARVLFSSNRKERWAVWSALANGTGGAELVYMGASSTYVTSAGPDGALCVEERNADEGGNISIVTPGSTPRPLIRTRYDEGDGVFSADGKWVAYVSNVSGRDEVYLIGSSGNGQPVQVSVSGGTVPKWGPLGTALYYRVGRSILRIKVADGQPKSDPERVFAGPVLDRGPTYSLSPDESRVLAVEVGPGAVRNEIRVITNFFDHVREIAGPGSRQEPKP